MIELIPQPYISPLKSPATSANPAGHRCSNEVIPPVALGTTTPVIHHAGRVLVQVQERERERESARARETERERERQTESESERDRERDRETERKRARDRKRKRARDRKRERERERERARAKDGHLDLLGLGLLEEDGEVDELRVALDERLELVLLEVLSRVLLHLVEG